MRAPLVVTVAAVLLSACARSAIVPIDATSFVVKTSAAPICGGAGAAKVAAQMAAIETIQRGHDRFLIVGGQAANNTAVVGHTPVTAHTHGHVTPSGHLVATTTHSGGLPIVAGTHDQGLAVRTFKDGDPAGANAISARATLGKDWKQAVEAGAPTCL